MGLEMVKYLTIAMVLFLLGVSGIFLNRKNIIIVLMSVELMLLAVNFNFIIFSVYLDDLIGQVFALFIVTVAAAESAIGLAILVVYYRKQGKSVVLLCLIWGQLSFVDWQADRTALTWFCPAVICWSCQTSTCTAGQSMIDRPPQHQYLILKFNTCSH